MVDSAASRRRVRCSAPGKVILAGEHAVVYGIKAIACAIALRTNVEAELMQEEQLSLHVSLGDQTLGFTWSVNEVVELLQQNGQWPPRRRLESVNFDTLYSILAPLATGDRVAHTAQVAFLVLYCLLGFAEEKYGMTVEITSKIPVASGLGSSAAFAAALSGALLGLKSLTDGESQSVDVDRETVNTLAFQLERVVHGTPSGVDNTVAVYGGALEFSKRDASVTMRQLPLRCAVPLLLTHTRVPKDTKKMVARVADYLSEQSTADKKKTLQEFGDIADAMATVLQDATSSTDLTALAPLMRRNHALLVAAGVSHDAIDVVADVCETRGVATKITGAGGGGCTISLLAGVSEETKQQVSDMLTQRGMLPLEAAVGGAGLEVTRL
ncbi:MAG: hypothetical protein MHM6MM_005836 [Cercozoa sp. M6MM]